VTSCCSTYDDIADAQFDERIARRDLIRYRENGPGSTTRLLRDLLTELSRARGTLLDVGSGVGALTFELLDRGMTRAVAVDASAAYMAAAAEEAARRDRADAVRFVQGDFLDLAADLPGATTVTLDRVICCYPLFESLLEESLRHADRCFAYSYPRDVWYVRVIVAADNLLRRIRGKAFRTFVHPSDRMSDVIRRFGFELAGSRRTLQWSADVYVRMA
jgi:magnesium-protoporphyrin O-methyltransferase